MYTGIEGGTIHAAATIVLQVGIWFRSAKFSLLRLVYSILPIKTGPDKGDVIEGTEEWFSHIFGLLGH